MHRWNIFPRNRLQIYFSESKVYTSFSKPYGQTSDFFSVVLQDGRDLAKRGGIVELSMAMFCEKNKIDKNVTTKRIVYQTF